MRYEFIEVTHDTITTLILNRPSKRNALHGPMIAELTDALRRLVGSKTQVVIIKGKGENFCAGGDIAWMQKMAATDSANHADAQALAELLYELYYFPLPTIASAHGVALGGGLGMLAAADIAIASEETVLGLPEVKIGLTPSIISPYVINAIGVRAAHYYFLTGKRFKADVGYQLNLIQHVTTSNNLVESTQQLAEEIVQNGPQALIEAKQLLRQNTPIKITRELITQTAEHLANLRITKEAQEGISAFIEKRKANWS